jgi:hypothetical protein
MAAPLHTPAGSRPLIRTVEVAASEIAAPLRSTRRCGDGPELSDGIDDSLVCSPRSRGWSLGFVHENGALAQILGSGRGASLEQDHLP